MAAPEELALARRTAALGSGLAAVTAVAFGLSFGFNYGVGNQVTYLIPALRRLDPELFSRDWFAVQTTQYHPVFAELGAALLSLDRRGWAVALGLTLTVTCAMLCLFGLARRLVGARAGVAVFFALVALTFATQTRGPALTYVFARELQPSSLSSACLLAAVLAFSAGRFLASSVLLGLGGLFHLNFLLLAGAAFALAHVLLGRERLAVRLAAQLVFPAACAALFLPTFLKAGAPGANAALGRHIYLAIRAPHHFVLGPQLAQFAPLVAWLCLGASAVVPLLRAPGREPWLRLGACATAMSAVVIAGTLAALATERAAPLFAWRLAPHAELLLALASIAAGVRVVLDRSLATYFGRNARAAVALGFVLVVGTYLARRDLLPAQVVGLAGLGGAAAWRLLPKLRDGKAALVTGAAFALLVGFAVGPLSRIGLHSSLFAPPSPARALHGFMRERTPKQSLFLTPPDEDSLRFFGERAIVVDWKGNPAVPGEVLEWYRRLEDVTGRPGFTDESALRGYDELDPGRLEALHARYGFDYAVLRRGHEDRFRLYTRVFEDRKYVVIELAPGKSAENGPP